jgi:HK97 family phage major capsid protein
MIVHNSPALCLCISPSVDMVLPQMNVIKINSEKRGALITEADLIVRSATVEKRAVSPTEEIRLDGIKAEVLNLDIAIEREKRSLSNDFNRQKNGRMPLDGYSLTRAIRQASAGRLDGLELEISQEIAYRSGRSPSGFYIPHALLAETRAMSVTGDSGNYGGAYVPTEHRGFIDALRPMLKVAAAGAMVIDGLTSNIAIPRQSAASTASWKSETATLDEATPTVDQLELIARRVGAYTVLSKQLLLQGSPSVEKLVRNDLLAACATALDAAAINGAGSPAPTGILGTSGIGNVIGGINGAAPTYQDIVDLIAAIESVDALAGSPSFMINPVTAAKLRSTPKVAGTDSRMILEGNDLLGYPVHISSNVPSNLNKGTSTGVCSAILFGNWNDVILASFGEGIDLVVDPFTNAPAGQTRIIANSYVDVGIRRAKSFAAMLDALTA